MSKPQPPSFYVGIGASAGGLEALESFFRAMPADSGMAFIVIQHLSPDYKSLMADILSKKTAMPVHQAEEGMEVLANTVSLIPPKVNMKIFHGKLTLSTQAENPRGINLPIDIFFTSLAEDQGRLSIGIILSGTGSDGTRGMRSIKEAAGLSIVQSPESAGFDGMPRSALIAGLGDYVLTPDAMPQQLLNYTNHPYKVEKKKDLNLNQDEDSMTQLFSLLRERHGVDFTYYKPSTIVRRIERRISINQVENLDAYIRYIMRNPAELNDLYRELLINVTSFFRDVESFTLLTEKIIPQVLEESTQDEIRIWSAACSTGEEAYSLAICFMEALANSHSNKQVKVFATDVDKEATVQASIGHYTDAISADIPTPLLEKYFSKTEHGYQVCRQLREVIVFAHHNLIKDPPFTNISFVSCRNMLIYLQPVMQRKVITLFNFALIPQGILFLGSSETVGDASDFFETIDSKWKILRSRGIRHLIGDVRQPESSFNPQVGSFPHQINGRTRKAHDYIHDRLLERFIDVIAENFFPFALLVNSANELIHVVGDSRRYLKIPSGKLQSDVSKLLVKELAIPAVTGIQKVLRSQTPLNYKNIRITVGEKELPVQMRICPVPHKTGSDSLVAIFLEEDEAKKSPEQAGATFDIDKVVEQRISDLEQELQFSQESLQATVEELETSNEELQATNEELLASNEELQSTNEELQSVNEELFTVNAEYQEKITNLTEANNDLDNLLTNVQKAFIFLDENLEVRRFTPLSSGLFKIMESDIGRPISHLAHDIVDIDIYGLVCECIKSSQEKIMKVMTANDAEYLMKITPYQVAPKIFSGVLLSFDDLTELKGLVCKC